VELDSYFLPDTLGSAYKAVHIKSTVAVNEIDIKRRYLGYFHSQGYWALEGDDFADAFQLEALVHERMLPPYIEYVKTRPNFSPPRGARLVQASLEMLRRHVAGVPAENPFARFKARMTRDLAWLLASDIENFHAYSFVTLRQCGACFELSETYLRWLGEQGVDGLEGPRRRFLSISEAAKAFQFQLARSMARRKGLDLTPLDAMAADWEEGIAALRRQYG
jgi:hypothetical protein